MKKIVIIETCDQCPHFDHTYYTYNEKCRLLNRTIRVVDYQHRIPDDCPLQDASAAGN